MLHITIYNDFEELYETPEQSGNDYYFEESDKNAESIISSAVNQNKYVVINKCEEVKL